jgi:hypothetical protein
MMTKGTVDLIDEGAVVCLLANWIDRSSTLVDTMIDLGHNDNGRSLNIVGHASEIDFESFEARVSHSRRCRESGY